MKTKKLRLFAIYIILPVLMLLTTSYAWFYINQQVEVNYTPNIECEAGHSLEISVDGGKTWTKTDYITAKGVNGKDIGMIQPTIWQDSEGTVHAMFRTDCGRIYRSDSYDLGRTWSEAYSTGLMNNYSGIDCVMTDDGRLWLVHTPVGMRVRNSLILSVSEDNGKTWKDVMTLEESKLNLFAEYSYPAIIAEGNNLYITYTYNRKTINYAFIEYKA